MVADNGGTVRIIPLDLTINDIFSVVDTCRSPSRKRQVQANAAFTHEPVRLWSPADDGAVDMHGKGL